MEGSCRVAGGLVPGMTGERRLVVSVGLAGIACYAARESLHISIGMAVGPFQFSVAERTVVFVGI
jgi:hypothetical protein